jgi:hypothetical protein
VERRFNRILSAFDQAAAFEKELGITPWRLTMKQ